MSKDLISRKAAIDKFIEASNKDGAYGYLDTKSAVGILNDLPSAQPKIITCENCKYGDAKPIADGRRWCRLHGVYMKYCSDAEVRTDEEADIS